MRRLALTAAVFALLAAACGEREPADPDPLAGIAIDACTLLTESDGEAALGIDLARMEAPLDEREGVREAKCSYGLAKGGPAKVLSLDVRRFRSRRQADLGRSIAQLRRMARGHVEQVPDLGDQAWWIARDVEQLHVQSGNKRIIVTVQLGPQERRLAVAREVARTTLERLR